ncbi:hemicentin-1 [Elysia marginata]|uniref:Hemicentin-1 n=1 Tax=Elysia marginata TaxID=1093978 RepID=A0AAV4J8U4_9GAST|nr:hemicentin-1 [Elysia marginata]
MASLHCFLVLALCLLQALHFSDAFHKRHTMKRFSLQKNRGKNRKVIPTGTDGYMVRRGIFFDKGSINGGTLEGIEFENVELECNVGGVPSPSIHWLKDGKRINQVCISVQHKFYANVDFHFERMQ